MGSDASAVNHIKFKNYKELEQNLRQSGVESLQCAIFIDFSKSNNWTGEKTYNGHSLHDINLPATPYEQVLNTLVPILHNFDDDDVYPVYRFGCAQTKDRMVCPLLYPQNGSEHFRGMDAVKQAYRQAVSFV